MYKPAFAAILVAACCNVAADNNDAKDNSTQHDNIEHISIYANRSQTAEKQVLASVTVLSRDEIVARQAADLPALLAQLPGINLSRDGGRGQSSGLYIRGGNTGHTLVIIDGVRSGSATLGYKSLSMLPLELIDRIEVIRGPRAALYGSDALAGVIAISTRRSESVEVNANVGSYGQVGADVSLKHSIEQLTLYTTVGASRAEGYNVRSDLDPDNDGYKQQFFNVAADYQNSFGLWRAQVDVNSGYYEFDNAWGSEDESDTLNRAYVVGWQQQFAGWQHQVQLSRNLDREVTYGGDSRSPFDTQRDEFTYQLSGDVLQDLQLTSGVNWYQEQVAKAAPQYTVDSRINRAVFAGVHYQLQSLLLEATARRDVFSQYGGQNTWQLAVGYQLNEQWLLRASRGTAFKAPTFNALYWPDYGNASLKPEESQSDELALSYNALGFKAQLAWFDRDVTNLIEGLESAENVLLAKVEGVEFSLSKQWQQWNTDVAYSYLDTENQATGLKLERRPTHTVNWRGAYNTDRWSLFVTADYQSSTFQGEFASVANVGGFTLWGVGGELQISPALNISASFSNLTDKQYQSSAGYATAGVSFGVNMRYTPQ